MILFLIDVLVTESTFCSAKSSIFKTIIAQKFPVIVMQKNQRCLSLKLLYFILNFLSIYVNLLYHLIVCSIPNGGDGSCFILLVIVDSVMDIFTICYFSPVSLVHIGEKNKYLTLIVVFFFSSSNSATKTN